MTDSPIINLCNTSKIIMSFCDGKGNLDEQKKCKHYKKSTMQDKCQYYYPDFDGHCGSIEAQEEARK